MHVACPSCRRENRGSARFCDECGAGLVGTGDRMVELRHGTFLFCDLVDSTRLANRLDLEDLRTVFRAFRDVVSRVARENGGFVYQFLGDGAFVSFGYPEAREDAEESAVRAGLEMIRSLRSLKPIVSVELDLRVGIASGTVVVGEATSGGAVEEESVIGSVPHLAARLLSQAPAGGLVVADNTRRLAGRFFE
jgi:class 3 adenylate cyclase